MSWSFQAGRQKVSHTESTRDGRAGEGRRSAEQNRVWWAACGRGVRPVGTAPQSLQGRRAQGRAPSSLHPPGGLFPHKMKMVSTSAALEAPTCQRPSRKKGSNLVDAGKLMEMMETVFSRKSNGPKDDSKRRVGALENGGGAAGVCRRAGCLCAAATVSPSGNQALSKW